MWYLIITTIIVVGTSCGVIKFFMELKSAAIASADPAVTPVPQTDRWLLFLSSVGASLIAAALIPLFLNATSSKLLDEIAQAGTVAAASGAPVTPTGTVAANFVTASAMSSTPYIIFFSFCVIAAYIQNQFIDRLALQVLSQIQEVKSDVKVLEKKTGVADAKAEEAKTKATKNAGDLEEAKRTLLPIVAHLVEPEDGEPVAIGREDVPQHLIGDMLAVGSSLTSDQKKVITALADARYAFRSLSGIAKSAGMEADATHAALEALEDRGLVEQHVMGNDRIRWSQRIPL
ncbi:MAG: YEATS-associated helix-containing protein [Armatimonadota bacterium]